MDRPLTTAGAGGRETQRGFTLIEMVVVMLLISLFMVISIPLFGSVGSGDLDASARRLSGTIKYLFNEAALTGLEHRLVYDLERGSYSAQVVGADGVLSAAEDQGRQASLRGAVRFRDLQLPGRGKFSAGQVTARFHPSGWVEETVIHLDDGGEKVLTMRVMPLTGVAEIFPGYRDF